jgi:hypothetical protein
MLESKIPLQSRFFSGAAAFPNAPVDQTRTGYFEDPGSKRAAAAYIPAHRHPHLYLRRS